MNLAIFVVTGPVGAGPAQARRQSALAGYAYVRRSGGRTKKVVAMKPFSVMSLLVSAFLLIGCDEDKGSYVPESPDVSPPIE